MRRLLQSTTGCALTFPIRPGPDMFFKINLYWTVIELFFALSFIRVLKEY